MRISSVDMGPQRHSFMNPTKNPRRRLRKERLLLQTHARCVLAFTQSCSRSSRQTQSQSQSSPGRTRAPRSSAAAAPRLKFFNVHRDPRNARAMSCTDQVRGMRAGEQALRLRACPHESPGTRLPGRGSGLALLRCSGPCPRSLRSGPVGFRRAVPG